MKRKSAMFRNFPLIEALYHLIVHFIIFRSQFLIDYEKYGNELWKMLFKVFGRKIWSDISYYLRFKTIKKLINEIIMTFRILVYEILYAIEMIIAELFLAKAILPYRLVNYLLIMLFWWFLVLYHEYIVDIRAFEMAWVREWEDANESYRFPAGKRWWNAMCVEIGNYYKDWIIIINLYFWPSLFFVRFYRWLSVNMNYISCYWFAWFELKYESYIWIMIHYLFSEWCLGYYPICLLVYLLGHFGQWGIDLEEIYEDDGTEDEELLWERINKNTDRQRYWQMFTSIEDKPILPYEKLQRLIREEEESLNPLTPQEVDPDEIQRRLERGEKIHPLAPNFKYLLDDNTETFKFIFPEGTELWDDEDPWRVTREFAGYLDNNKYRVSPGEINEWTLFGEAWPHFVDLMQEIKRNERENKAKYFQQKIGPRFIWNSIRYMDFDDPFDCPDWIEHVVRPAPSVFRGMITQVIVFRYFRYMRGVVGPFTPYHPAFDLVSRYLRSKEEYDLIYWYKRGIWGRVFRKFKQRRTTKMLNNYAFLFRKHLELHRKKQHGAYVDEYTANLSRNLHKDVKVPKRYTIKYYYEPVFFVRTDNFFSVKPSKNAQPNKYFFHVGRVHDYVDELFNITVLGFIRRYSWIKIKQFFSWIHPLNWWKRRKALKVLLRFEKESRVLLKNKKKNFRFFMVDKSSTKPDITNNLDKQEYPGQNSNTKSK